MTEQQALDNPDVAHAAWSRFKRLMIRMAVVGLVLVGLVLGYFHWRGGPMPIHMIIATSLGIWLTFMLGTSLMLLMFLSAGTGHDDVIIDPLKDEPHIKDQLDA